LAEFAFRIRGFAFQIAGARTERGLPCGGLCDSTARARRRRCLRGKLENGVMSQKPINYLRLSTLVAVAILVGTELVGASWAAGWALGGLFQLDPLVSRALEVIFSLAGLIGLYFFMRTAIRNEPIRG
jgi:hypothetical protein